MSSATENLFAGTQVIALTMCRDFKQAHSETQLPERPDYDAANGFLVKARREMTK